jgi:Icc protein
VLQITDTHLYADLDSDLLGLKTEESLCEVIAEARSIHWPVDMVLATGDLVHDKTVAGYRRIRAHFERLGVPVYCLAGNHDEARVLSRVVNGGPVRYTDHAYMRNWHFIFLDSTIPGSEGGHLSPHQLALLNTHLQENRDLHTLVCLHHQPVPVGSRWLDTMAVDNAEPFFDIIDSNPQVRGILWGHVHQEFAQMRNGVHLLATPSTCIQFKPGSQTFAIDASCPGYRWLNFYPDGRIESGVHRLQEIPGEVQYASNGY